MSDISQDKNAFDDNVAIVEKSGLSMHPIRTIKVHGDRVANKIAPVHCQLCLMPSFTSCKEKKRNLCDLKNI